MNAAHNSENDADIDEAAQSIESADLGAASATLGDAVRIVKGNPSDEEIAALVAVLTAAAASADPVADTRPPELWGSPAAMHRTFAPFSPYSFAASRRY